MKKYIITVIFIAALALSACTRIEPETQGYTLTISATKGTDDAVTKALSPDGKALKSTWDGTEKVLVYRRRGESYTYIGTLSAAVSSSETTILSGTMNISPEPDKGDYLDFYYLDTRWDYSGQDGTLETIAKRYDFCSNETLGPERYHVEGRNIVNNEEVALRFVNKSQAVVKFILKDKATGENINPTSFTVSGAWVLSEYDNITDAYGHYDGNLTFGPLSGTSNELFAALHFYVPTEDWTLSLSAETATGDTYHYEKTAIKFFDDGKYYEVTVKMTKEP